MALSTPTVLDREVLSYLLEVRDKQRKITKAFQAKFGNPLPMDSKRTKQFNMICNRIKDARRFREKAVITEAERIDLGDFAQFIIESFHDAVGTPIEQRPKKETHVQTFLG